MNLALSMYGAANRGLEVKENMEMGSTEMLKGKDQDETVWVENLLVGDSVYRSDATKDQYRMAPNGIEGSVVAVPVKVAKEAFFRRALSRGKVQLLTDQEASDRELALIEATDHENDEFERINKALEEGASEVGARYSKEGLSDDAHERSSISAKEALTGKKADATSSSSRPARRAKPKEEPLVIPEVITERVQQGDWESDTE